MRIPSCRIMILDGSMGCRSTPINLLKKMYAGSRFASHSHGIKNCTEALVLTQPRIIEDIHRAYLEAVPTSSRPTPLMARRFRSRNLGSKNMSLR